MALAVCISTAVAVGATWLVFTHPPRPLRPLSQWLHLLVAWATSLGWSKAKIGLAFYQCAINLHQIYDVVLPDSYTEWMKAFGWIELDWAGAVLPVECLNGYLNRMILTTTAPLGFAALPLLYCLCAARARRQSNAAAMQSALPVVLFVVFSCASSTSRAIFMVWECAASAFYLFCLVFFVHLHCGPVIPPSSRLAVASSTSSPAPRTISFSGAS